MMRGSPSRDNDDDDDDDDVYSFSGVPIRVRHRPSREPTSGGDVPASVNPDASLNGSSGSTPAPPPGPVGGGAQTNIRVTPYTPSGSPEQRRQRSAAALTEARLRIFEATGVRPRLVTEPITGMRLPYTDIVDTSAPVVRYDGAGQPVYVEAPDLAAHRAATASAGGRGGPGRSGGVAGESTTHYRRSVEAVTELRQRRVQRMVEQL